PYPGREALVRQQQQGVPKAFVTVECDVKDSDPWGNEPLYANGTMVGRTTSGAYGYAVGKSLALAYIQKGHEAPGTKLEIELLGDRRPARIIPESPWDPENKRLRA